MATTFQKEAKPGSGGDVTLTWADMWETWEEVSGTWAAPRSKDATSFTKESKSTTSFSRESKP